MNQDITLTAESSMSPEQEANLIPTFRHMTSRKLIRIRNGHFRKAKHGFIWFFLLALLAITLCVMFVYNDNTNYYTNIILVMLVLLGVYLMTKLSQPLRLMLYWILIFLIILKFAEDSGSAGTPSMSVFVAILIAVFVTAEVFTIVYFLVTWIIYPRLVYWEWINAYIFWNIKKIPNTVNCYSYYTFEFNRFVASNRRFSYRGEVHPETKLPHGWGTWTDDSLAGEYLYGYFRDGIPIGPFNSNEFGTGCAFTNIRCGVVFATNDKWGSSEFIPKPNPRGAVTFGVAGVECSISGKFFMELPAADLISGTGNKMETQTLTKREILNQFPQYQDAVSWMMSYMEMEVKPPVSPRKNNGHSMKSITIETSAEGHLLVPGYYPSVPAPIKVSVSLNASDDVDFEVDGFEKVPDDLYEALIFFPGFNCSPDVAACRLGQLFSLANFPSRIKPFIFSWPGGQIFTYFQALKTAECEETSNNFRDFLLDLISSGKFNKVHLLGHSMGCRALLSCSRVFHDIFHEKTSSGLDLSTATKDKITLASLTLMNAEANLEKFMNVDYSRISKCCHLTTIFADESDFPLKVAEIFSGQHMLGKYALKRLRMKQIRDLKEELLKQTPSNTENVTSSESSLTNDINESNSSSPVTRRRRFRLGTANLSYLAYDLDCIDTTNLDANVHEMRHMYFNLNKIVVDDYRDIVLNQKRAAFRDGRLLHIDSNVYTFLNAPSYVVNP
ncbi:hypothetical protein MP638_003850 [Amoeboaphelidium occidentale]|nr:hypothetical protein MP638_003850 [Amoeboaphelidium occidentale]